MNDTVLAAEQGRFGAIEPDHGHAGTPSLPQVHRSIAVPRGDSRSDNARRVLAFAGPGYMVAVGYMDPGNWATSIAGGSQFGYSLLAVIFASNLMAMLFQAAAVRLGLASGRDLARPAARSFPRASIWCCGSSARSPSWPAIWPRCWAWPSA